MNKKLILTLFLSIAIAPQVLPMAFNEEATSKLLTASAKRSCKSIKRFIKAGADVNAQDNRSGWTALIYAVSNCNVPVIKELLDANAHINLTGKYGETALMKAAKNGSETICELLIAHGANLHMSSLEQEGYCKTAFTEAAMYQYEAVCKLLIKHGAAIDAPLNSNGDTLLMQAAQEGRAQVCKLLHSLGANFNAQNKLGETALLKATKNRSEIMCRQLLTLGAKIVVQQSNEQIALLQDALIEAAGEGQEFICRATIAHGAHVNAQNKLGETALLRAAHNEDVYTKLRALGARVIFPKNDFLIKRLNQKLVLSASLDQEFACRSLIAHGADVNVSTIDGGNPLMEALKKKHSAICKLLLDHGARIDHLVRLPNNHRESSLDYIARSSACGAGCRFFIIHSLFNPAKNCIDQQNAKESIFTALLTLKRVCPRLNRDMRYKILQSAPELQDALQSCAFGIHRGHNERAPFLLVQTVRTLLEKGLLKPELVMQFIKENQYKNLKPLMLQAQRYARTNEVKASLNPETLETKYGAAIEANIRRVFNLKEEEPKVELIEEEHDAISIPEMNVTTRKREREENLGEIK